MKLRGAQRPDQREHRLLNHHRQAQASNGSNRRLVALSYHLRWDPRELELDLESPPFSTLLFSGNFLHIVYLRALLVRNRRLFFRICFVASCEMAVAGRTGPNAARIMPKVHDMWVNSLAALLGASGAIQSAEMRNLLPHAVR